MTRNGTKCYGVDLRSNFGKSYGKNFEYTRDTVDFWPCFLPFENSNDPCSLHYRGRRPFSEPETAALRNYLFRKMRRSMKR